MRTRVVVAALAAGSFASPAMAQPGRDAMHAAGHPLLACHPATPAAAPVRVGILTGTRGAIAFDSRGDLYLLSGIDRDVTKNPRIGVGCTFTDFSDGLTDFAHDHEGWFINLTGRY